MVSRFKASREKAPRRKASREKVPRLIGAREKASGKKKF